MQFEGMNNVPDRVKKEGRVDLVHSRHFDLSLKKKNTGVREALMISLR